MKSTPGRRSLVSNIRSVKFASIPDLKCCKSASAILSREHVWAPSEENLSNVRVAPSRVDVDRFGGERVKVEDTKQVNPTTLANNTTASSDPRHYPVPATSSRNQTFLVAARASEVVSLRFTHSIRQSHRTRDSEAARVRISSRTRLAVEQPSARAIDRSRVTRAWSDVRPETTRARRVEPAPRDLLPADLPRLAGDRIKFPPA